MNASILSIIENSRKRGKGTPLRECAVASCGRTAKSKSLCEKHYHRYRKFGDPLHAHRAGNGEKKAFLDAVVTANDTLSTECIFWPFKYREIGYGTFRFDGKDYLAHRYVCEKVKGPAPEEFLQAAHSCGNGASGCVSPNHLRWATPLENAADKATHGTVRRGEGSGRAKFTDEVIDAVKALKGQMPQRAIAAKFGMSQTYVGELFLSKKRAST